MGWKEKVLGEARSLYVDKNIGWKEWSRGLRFRVKLMCFIDDWLSWDAVKSGWVMPRMQFKMWKFYRKHSYLKK